MILPAAYSCNFIQYFKSWESCSKHNAPTCLLPLWRYPSATNIWELFCGNSDVGVITFWWVHYRIWEWSSKYMGSCLSSWGHISYHSVIWAHFKYGATSVSRSSWVVLRSVWPQEKQSESGFSHFPSGLFSKCVSFCSEDTMQDVGRQWSISQYFPLLDFTGLFLGPRI